MDASASSAKKRRPNRSQPRTSIPKCKTCVSCRLRKSKCDGVLPHCGYCTSLGRDCSYPQDTRTLGRPTTEYVRRLEANVEALQKVISQNGISIDDQSGHLATPLNPRTPGHVPPRDDHETYASGREIMTPETQNEHVRTHGHLQGRNLTASHHSETGEAEAEGPADEDAGPSPSEMRIAGAVTEDGGIEVHGVSSMFHRQSASGPETAPSWYTSSTERQAHNQIAQARLVAYASLQRQREPLLLKNPSMNQNVDFDGVDPELALHLINAHFNRQHYTFMISYRPAITDSLVSSGPYCNNILLNAIYLSSSVYSDRVELRSNPSDRQSAGERFYQRLRSLFVDHIDQPSIPTAVGLLLSGAILVSTGRVSAGWMHSGIAYRMIIDLGCHLAVESRRKDLSSDMALLTDIELEIRKRLYWGAFLTDATQSLYFGRPPSLRASQARVPQLLLDTYEELEVWTPYVDPSSPPAHEAFPSYVPRPAYAVSTFNGMVRLMGISSRIVNAFYGMQSLKSTPSSILDLRANIEVELERWLASLPNHLKFNPDHDSAFPPHQMALLTTYHTLQILLHRPFLAKGHLTKHVNEHDRKSSDRISVDAALAIWRLVGSYQTTFGLYRAPYLVSYSVYSAIVAVLNQKLFPREEFTDCMSFFWSALIDLRRSCNFGLQKPIEILREMMSQFGEGIPRLVEMQEQRDIVENIYRGAEERGRGERIIMPAAEPPLWDAASLVEPGGSSLGSVFDEADWPVNDALYGLFTPDPSFLSNI